MPETVTKYSNLLAEWLAELGYTHCFFVAGGNIMHLLDALRTRMACIPVVHEVAAGIATEYFNEVGGSGKAFALVTAGPGLTNIVTAVAGAWLESRELLVIGGQVKSTDLATGGIRQRGIQEVDGVAIVRPDLRAGTAHRGAARAARGRRRDRGGRDGPQRPGVFGDLPGRASRAGRAQRARRALPPGGRPPCGRGGRIARRGAGSRAA